MVGTILSKHYDTKHPATYEPIKREGIISGKGNPPTQWSYGRGAPILIPAKGTQGNVVYNNITPNNVWTADDVPRNGYFSPQIDDGVTRGGYHFPSFDRWKAGSKPPIQNDYVKLPTNSVAMESFGEIKGKFIGQTQLPKYVHEYDFEGPNNLNGKALFELHNHRGRVTRYFGTKIAQSLANEAIKAGENLEDIGHLVVGGLPDGADYMVGRNKEGKIVLAVADKLFERAAQEARRLGIDAESYLETMLAEEHAHILRRSFDKEGTIGDRIDEEVATKNEVHQNYLKLAKEAEGGNSRNPKYERERTKIRRQAKIMEDDTGTARERYRKFYSKGTGSLKSMLYMDALEKGLRGGAADEYVEGRLYQIEKEIAEEAEGKSVTMSRLENIADREIKHDKVEGESTKEAEPAESPA